MRIGFFGGCFNPPTNIHIGIAKELIDSKILDKVIFVPVGDFYKKENLISAIHRYEMIKKAIECGTSKINVNTELQASWSKAVREFLQENKEAYDPRKVIGAGEEAIKNKVKEKIEVFNTRNS